MYIQCKERQMNIKRPTQTHVHRVMREINRARCVRVYIHVQRHDALNVYEKTPKSCTTVNLNMGGRAQMKNKLPQQNECT